MQQKSRYGTPSAFLPYRLSDPRSPPFRSSERPLLHLLCGKIGSIVAFRPYLGSLKELFRETIRLNTGFSSVLSLQSTQK